MRAEFPDAKRNNSPISLVILKLIAPPLRPTYYPPMPASFGGNFNGMNGLNGGMMGMIGMNGMGLYPPAYYGFGYVPWPSARPYPVPPNQAPQHADVAPERKFVTTEVFRDRTATIHLSEPGPYKLLAILHSADGKKIEQEVGCIVKAKDDLPQLSLQLENENLQAGEDLHGTIRSRFSDALVLLTVRDSTGYRTWTPIRLKNGSAEIRQKLPGTLRYGAVVEVHYTDKPTTEAALFAGKTIHVVPTDRMVTIRDQA